MDAWEVLLGLYLLGGFLLGFILAIKDFRETIGQPNINPQLLRYLPIMETGIIAITTFFWLPLLIAMAIWMIRDYLLFIELASD